MPNQDSKFLKMRKEAIMEIYSYIETKEKLKTHLFLSKELSKIIFEEIKTIII